MEIILVDGGSEDDTLGQAQSLVDAALTSPKGRALQMNVGARQGQGDWLLFLHADTQLPENLGEIAVQWRQKKSRWGFFLVRLGNKRMIFKIIAFFINLRSRLTRVASGDQCLFIEKRLFDDLGGFPDIPLMEDIAMAKKLRRCSAPIIEKHIVTTSSRRWEQNGVLRTVLQMWYLRWLFFIGVAPEQLVRRYYPDRQ